MNRDCPICNGEDGYHNTWMGKVCPRAPISKRPVVPSLKDLTREALSGSKAAEDIAELYRIWMLKP